MSPPGGMAGAGAAFFGFSATIASVVMSRPATDAASSYVLRQGVGRTLPFPLQGWAE